MTKNLRKELEEYCKSIDIQYIDRFTLIKSVNGIEYPIYPKIQEEIFFDNREEVLFVMLYLFSEGFYYYNTLYLTDSIVYQDDRITSFYKYFSLLLYKFSSVICIEVSPFINPNEFITYKDTESSFILTQIHENISKLLFDRNNEVSLIDHIIFLTKKALKTKFKPVERGFSYLNSLHFTCNIIVTELNMPSFEEILTKIENDLKITKAILLSKNPFIYSLNNTLNVINLNIMFKSVLFNYFSNTHYKYFFCDFGILLKNLGSDSNLTNEYEKNTFFVEILSVKGILDNKKDYLMFITLYFEQNKRKLADFPQSKCYWTKEMYKIYKLL